MRAPRTAMYASGGSNPPVKVPEAQVRALDHRHALDQQQRGFMNSAVRPVAPGRPRPPG